MGEGVRKAPFKIAWWKVLVPVSIGIGVSVYLILNNFNPAALRNITVSEQLIIGLLLATLTVVVRDGSFMYKLRLSACHNMTWRKTFQTVMMWEFAACITPKISEAALVLFILKKSGLSYGRSAAVLLLNTLLDNAAFVLVFSVLYCILGNKMFLFSALCPDLQGHVVMSGLRNIAGAALIGYGLIFLLCVFLALALFVFPHAAKIFFGRIAGYALFSNFKGSIIHLGNEIEIASHEFGNQSSSFWLRMYASTLLNWVSRYALVCALVFAFSSATFNMLEVFARQYILWVFYVVPSTPGASGVAEVLFMAMNCEFFPIGLAAAVALIWRIYSYYIYLLLGMILLPKWARQVVEN